jgi:hypothetical protein
MRVEISVTIEDVTPGRRSSEIPVQANSDERINAGPIPL